VSSWRSRPQTDSFPLGLGYESLRAINPGVIMISSCLMGQSGPMSRFAGFGQLSAAMAALYDLTG